MPDAIAELSAVATAHAVIAESLTPPFTGFTSRMGGTDAGADDEPDVEGLDPAREAIMGATFAIEYTDATGNETRRRITALQFRDGCLMARCHERRALRTFRMDRITCVIDRQGVVYGTEEFFRLIDFPLAPFGGEYVYVPGLQMLAAVAYADGWMVPAEAESILQYCVHLCDNHGIIIDARLERQMVKHIAGVYPARAAVDASFKRMRTMAPADRRLLFRYAVEVMNADNIQHPAEFAAIQAMQAELG